MDPTFDIFDACVAEPIVAADGREHPTLALLRWSPPIGDTWVLQIYVDDALFDVVTKQGSDRHLLRINRSEGAVIEMLAVDSLDPWALRPPGMSGFGAAPPTRRLTIEAHRDPGSLDPGDQLGLLVNGELMRMEPIWSVDAARPGFGVCWGTDDFGFGMAVGPGFGNSESGMGPFGCGGSMLRESLALAAGAEHQIEVVLIDRHGAIVSDEPIVATAEVYEVVSRPTAPEVDSESFEITWEILA